MNNPPRLTNAYAREYYDAQVGPLSSYQDQRWHSSPVREFEYRQTKRALLAALAGRTYKNALEIGPGDGVWTALVRERVSGALHLIEQSGEMLARAKERFAAVPGITFEHADFAASNPPGGSELIVAVRCFEYFEDKPGALKKMQTLLTPGGKLIIITKNPQMLTSVPAQGQVLHEAQISRARIHALAFGAGLRVEHVYPAILRWKAAYPVMRGLFDLLHRAAVATRGLLVVPGINTYAAESYVYVMSAYKHGQD